MTSFKAFYMRLRLCLMCFFVLDNEQLLTWDTPKIVDAIFIGYCTTRDNVLHETWKDEKLCKYFYCEYIIYSKESFMYLILKNQGVDNKKLLTSLP